MRKFQIWLQNSNRIIFDPPFGQKLLKTGKVHALDNFRQFLGQNVGQIEFDLNFETRFEILSSFSLS